MTRNVEVTVAALRDYCPRCGQLWNAHTRTTDGKPATYPKDCPPAEWSNSDGGTAG